MWFSCVIYDTDVAIGYTLFADIIAIVYPLPTTILIYFMVFIQEKSHIKEKTQYIFNRYHCFCNIIWASYWRKVFKNYFISKIQYFYFQRFLIVLKKKSNFYPFIFLNWEIEWERECEWVTLSVTVYEWE